LFGGWHGRGESNFDMTYDSPREFGFGENPILVRLRTPVWTGGMIGERSLPVRRSIRAISFVASAPVKADPRDPSSLRSRDAPPVRASVTLHPRKFSVQPKIPDDPKYLQAYASEVFVLREYLFRLFRISSAIGVRPNALPTANKLGE
jgi:hypothetical protein